MGFSGGTQLASDAGTRKGLVAEVKFVRAAEDQRKRGRKSPQLGEGMIAEAGGDEVLQERGNKAED